MMTSIFSGANQKVATPSGGLTLATVPLKVKSCLGVPGNPQRICPWGVSKSVVKTSSDLFPVMVIDPMGVDDAKTLELRRRDVISRTRAMTTVRTVCQVNILIRDIFLFLSCFTKIRKILWVKSNPKERQCCYCYPFGLLFCAAGC